MNSSSPLPSLLGHAPSLPLNVEVFVPLSLARTKLVSLASELVPRGGRTVDPSTLSAFSLRSLQFVDDLNRQFGDVLTKVKEAANVRIQRNEEEIASLKGEVEVLRLSSSSSSPSAFPSPPPSSPTLVQTQIKEIVKNVIPPNIVSAIRTLESQINDLSKQNWTLRRDLIEVEEREKKKEREREKEKEKAAAAVDGDIDEHSAERSEFSDEIRTLHSDISELTSSLSRTISSSSSIEGGLKPKVNEYKIRLQTFKEDVAKLKAAEQSAGLSMVRGADGTDREITPMDYEEMGGLLEEEAKLAARRKTLTERVQKLKEQKSDIDEKKSKLNELKATIVELKMKSSDVDEIKSKEDDFNALRTSLTDSANELKSQYAQYESDASEFKAADGDFQFRMAKFHIFDALSEAERQSNIHSLMADKRSLLESLITSSRQRQSERESLKSFADEINNENSRLRQCKADRSQLERDIAEKKANVDRLVEDLNKLPPPRKTSTTKSTPSKTAVVDESEEERLRRLRSIGDFKPIAPMVIKEVETIVSEKTLDPIVIKPQSAPKPPMLARTLTRQFTTMGLNRQNTSLGSVPSKDVSVTVDSELSARFDSLQLQYSSRLAELTTLREKLKEVESAHRDDLTMKSVEVSNLKSQIQSLSSQSDDERVRSLSERLDVERAQFEDKSKSHFESLKSLQSQLESAQKDVEKKEAEMVKLQQKLDVLVKPALGRALSRTGTLAKGMGIQRQPTQISIIDKSVEREEMKEKDPSLPSPTHSTARIFELESKLRDNETALRSAQSEIDSLKRISDGDSASMRREVTSLNEKVGVLEKAKSELTNQIERLKQREAELEEVRADLSSELESLRAQHVEELTQSEQKMNAAFNAQLSTLEEEHEATVGDFNAKMAALTAQFDLEKSERIRTQNDLNQTTSERDRLRTENADMIKKVKEATESVAPLKNEVKAKTEELEKRAGQIVKLDKDLADSKQAFSLLEIRYREEQTRRKEFQFKYEDAKGKVRVYARVRPFTSKEVEMKESTLLRPGRNEWTLDLNETQTDYMGKVTDKWREFAFDHVFQFGLDDSKGNGTQAEVFEETKIFADLSMQGINTCVFAYGQSGTGKTFTMAGVKPSADNNFSEELLGLKPRMIRRIFQLREEQKVAFEYDISSYMVEIYLNRLEDLYFKIDQKRSKSKAEPPELKVRVDAKKRVTIDGVRIKSFKSADEILSYMDEAEETRRTRRTGLNEASSRSHLVFAILIEQTDLKTGKKVKGKLSLVDLAGSERADKTNVDGLSKAQRDAMMEEGVAINESLRMLKNVFRILGTQHLPPPKGQKPEVVQYRGNMLTELMQDSLGGAAKTLMFVNVGPAASNVSESIDSLQYGDYVKNITNEKPAVDEDFTEQIRRLKDKIKAYQEKFGDL